MEKEEIRKRLKEEGFFVLKQVLNIQEVEKLKEESIVLLENKMALQDYFRDTDDFIINLGCIVEPVSPDDLKYQKDHFKSVEEYEAQRYNYIPPTLDDTMLKCVLEKDFFSHVFDEKELFLFNEQFIIKPRSNHSTEFGWHRDSDSLATLLPIHPEYYSIWIPIDPVSEELKNGALIVKSFKDNNSEKMLNMNPGDLVIFSDKLLHRSPPNRSPRTRRAYMIQVSKEAICFENREPVVLAVPFPVIPQRQ